MSSASAPRSAISIRRARPEDAAACGRICHQAFHKINTDHNFPPDLPSVEAGTQVIASCFSHPCFYSVVAEADGLILGSNCMDERGAIAGIGPITVDPATQNQGVGRELMEAVLGRAREKNFAGVRLVQAAFHNRSLSLYTKLGFDAKEPLSVMQGPAIGQLIDGYRVRAAQTADLEACNRVCQQVHGHDRSGELADAIGQGSARVVERNGRITGYTSALAFFGHSEAESNADLEALIAAADGFGGPGFLVPTRNSALFRWCLANGLRVVQPMTLMSVGLYNEPKGAFLPSITY
ncbi:MAG TPA: GNAT family N-acetyltransferase [Bryobacteraceae bacterium]|nr:GNAT family N-acetyltransferase [Bryobacteraceae bacterium]